MRIDINNVALAFVGVIYCATPFVMPPALSQVPNEPVLKSYGPLTYPPIARAARISGTVTIEFLIDNSGKTVSVASIDGPAMLRGGAEEFVKSWLFEPSRPLADPKQKYQAHISFKAIEGIVDPRAANAPTIKPEGSNNFEIAILVGDIILSDCPTGREQEVPSSASNEDFVEIGRSSCMGSCPDYSLRVQADGIVSWEGRSSVKVMGKRNVKIDSKSARNLLEQFRTPEFWSYCGRYSRQVTDSSTAGISVRLGGRTRNISDYAESSPGPLQDLLIDVDRVADSHQWRHGDPASEPISQIASDTWLPKPGVTPLMLAVGRNEVDQIRELIKNGADVSATDSSGWTPLMYAAFVTSDFPTQILLKAGANPNQGSPRGDTPLMVGAAFGGWNSDLVAAGAKLNAQNFAGQTALMYLASRGAPLEISEALHAGADPSLKDKKGRTALDYLALANCGRSPFNNPVQDWMRGPSTKCNAIWSHDFRECQKLLRNAMHNSRGAGPKADGASSAKPRKMHQPTEDHAAS